MNNESPVVAGMDVHKRMLAVVVAKVDGNRIEYLSERFGTTRQDLDQLAHWLHQQQVTEVAMESTAQYWMPVWLALEEQFTLYLAQPRSTAAPKGRKSDWADAQRIVRRLLAQDLTLSYVPGREQREWRTMTRTRVEMSAQQVRLRNQMEGLLEQAQIKLSSVLSDLLGVSGRRILREMVKGETNPACLASLADKAVKASEKTLQEALGGKLTATHRLLLKMYLEQWDLLASQIDQLNTRMAQALSQHQAAVHRLVEIPGVSLTAAQQIIAEVGPEARAFAAPQKLASWVGVCPGQHQSAGTEYSHRSPKGNRMMRRVLVQCAWASVKVKGSIFHQKFRALVPRLGPRQAIWAIAHRLLRIIWKLLHDQVNYVERGLDTNPAAVQLRIKRHLKELQRLGYAVNLSALAAIRPQEASV